MPKDRLIVPPASVVQCTCVGEARAYCYGKPCVVCRGDGTCPGTYILRQTVFVDIPVRVTARADGSGANRSRGGEVSTVECRTHAHRRISTVVQGH